MGPGPSATQGSGRGGTGEGRLRAGADGAGSRVGVAEACREQEPCWWARARGAPAERVPVFLCRESGPQLPGAAVDTQRRGPVLPVLPVRPLLLARGFPPKQAAVRRWSYLFLKAKMMQPSPLWEGWGVGMGCLAPLNQQPWKITAGRLGGLSQRWKKSVPMDASC